MRVFVSEFVCGGGWPGGCPGGSLQTEGAAMLLAAIEDFARIPDCRVATTWDPRLGPFPIPSPAVVASLPGARDQEAAHFDRLASECDATLVIAPEFHDLLARRAARVLAIGGRLLGPAPHIIRLCGDKVTLCERLQNAGVPAIPTSPIPPQDARRRLPYPVVVKPRCGAGSVNTHLVRTPGELQAALAGPHDPPDLPPDIWQPFIAGRALSIAALGTELFPVAEQRLTADGRFRYLGGSIPARDVDAAAVHGLARSAIAALGNGARGYIGLDIVMPRDSSQPLIAEINPRLTTSYLGYRRHCRDNIAGAMLSSGEASSARLRWRADTRIEFAPDGRMLHKSNSPPGLPRWIHD